MIQNISTSLGHHARRFLGGMAILACLFGSVHAFAASASTTEKTPELEIRLISGVKGTQTNSTSPLPLGLEITLAPHWKTYWRTPGTVGFPARISTKGSTNVAETQILWPTPTRFNQSGLQALGYTNHVILPLNLTPEIAGLPVHLIANVNLMACAELCVPFDFTLTLDLPAEPAEPSAYADQITAARAKVPQAAPADLIKSVTLEKAGLKVELSRTTPLSGPTELFVETSSGAQFDAPIYSAASPSTLFAPLLSVKSPPKAGAPLTLTLVSADGAVEAKTRLPEAPLPPEATAEAAPATAPSLLWMLFIAFVGGMILNLMPCVLPVLSLKIISVLGHAGAAPRHMRLHLLASALGIITSFMGLAAVAQSLKSAGMVLGWGVQFQHAGFLVGMMVLLTLFAASLWGLLHIPLPRFMADAIADRLPGPGEHDRTLVGNFITGAFATLLATPCSAPFVGTAIGFALAGNAFQLFATALMMSLGMAAPFLLMALKPELGRFLPRPGRWMTGLKAILGLALMGTVFWLSTMLHRQLSMENAAMMTALPLIILVVLWIAASVRRPIRFVQGLGVMLLLVAGSWLFHLPIVQNTFNRPASVQETAALAWQPFEENKISDLVARGKIVMVDITADWCLTCAANEKFVLSSKAGQALLSDKNVVLMRGDWTTPSPEITAYLRRHGRYGIPFNIVYSPKNPHGVVLPELLTLDALAMALNPMNCLDSKTRAC